jgi:type IV pilus assembly protein PilA
VEVGEEEAAVDRAKCVSVMLGHRWEERLKSCAGVAILHVRAVDCWLALHYRQQKETIPMLQALRRRLERDEEGFTLIELMVVVLIIAILLAIAIPTFLGARTKAQDRAAQSNLRNALTGEKTYYTDNQAYTNVVTALQAIEPALQWQTAAPTSAGQVQVTAANGNSANNDVVTLTAKSASGTCFTMYDETTTGTIAPGTWYVYSTTCAAVPAAPTTAPTVKAGNGTWGANF